MIKNVVHVGISVNNLKNMLKFYCDVLGFELVYEMEWKQKTPLGNFCDHVVGLKNSEAKTAMVKKGHFIIEMFEYLSPTPKPISSDWKVSDHGYTHICLEVDDLDGEYKRLLKAGMTFHTSPPDKATNGLKAIYGRDPEGHVIELLENIPAS